MRMTSLFVQTLRETPAEAAGAGHQLLLRSGLARTSPGGGHALLPLGLPVKRKLEGLYREAMAQISAQEMEAPLLGPADLVADLVRRQVRSYKQLPVALYRIQRETRHPAELGGAGSPREFTGMSLDSFHAGAEDLDRFYREVQRAYLELFRQLGLEPAMATSESSATGEATAHRFVCLGEAGDEALLGCPTGDYLATLPAAAFAKEAAPEEPPQPLEEVLTPDCKTIEGLAQFLGVPKERTAKVLLLMAADRLLFAIVRGDMALSETKLSRLLRASSLRPATAEEIRRVGAVPGYASPVGLKGVRVVVDDLIARSPNLVAGANREGYHLRNVNYGRDFTADLVGDIAAAQEKDPCPRCGTPLESKHGIAIAGMRKAGTEWSEAAKAHYLDPTGRGRPLAIGSYFLDSWALLVSAVERSHDDRGILWPPSIAPFQLYLMTIGGDKPEVSGQADRFYSDFRRLGIDTLFDDRSESPGVKFGDSDLIGLPLRLTVSQRGLKQGEVELKRCSDGTVLSIKVEEAVEAVKRELGD